MHPIAAELLAGAEREVDDLDVEQIVDVSAGMVAAGRGDEVLAAVREAGRELGAAASLQLPASAHQPIDWAPFGTVVPVLAGSPGAGASCVAAALADALQLAARCVLIVDAADPARSGLAGAASAEGPWTSQISAHTAIRFSWRDQALLARVETDLPAISPGLVPPPPEWLPRVDPLHVTVVDIGHDGWRTTANPLLGAGGWLRNGAPAPRPVLVVRATRPSLRHAEQVLARLDSWVSSGIAVPPAQLAVVGAKKWPAGVAGAAGRRLDGLLDDAVFVPLEQSLEIGGITDELLPDRVLDAVTPLLTGLGLFPESDRSRSRKARR
ncbi:hypothetical protein [Pseudonocardia sp. WMMC193]|uniref:hypothetical protein n=1 Tax=Pseudonocardia sp. WMMC193 TaxID=2911965 RepID=UPI001F21437E|nr:hypothetical protein [Pseudonocardia sp. WMMC193]MCF7547273.1 hypothetical protein [Pseudonocardia sp. WMMC193]MCF7547368.1 hypothetical protein [Pseudonocardia sp. WMMC193]